MLQCIKILIMNSTVLGSVQTQNKCTELQVKIKILVIYIRGKKENNEIIVSQHVMLQSLHITGLMFEKYHA